MIKRLRKNKALADEAYIACEADNWRLLAERLRADNPNEACAFVLARPSRGVVRTTLILKEVIWPEDGEVDATPYSLEISADYISRAMDTAINAGELTGVVLIHTHPDGNGRFSPRDDWYENRLFPTFTLDRPSAICGSIVLGETGLDARIWWNDGTGLTTQDVNIVKLVGPNIRFIETPHSSWKDHPDPLVMDRSTRIWGIEGRRRLQNIRVGVVGVGGTGSITVLSLATMGAGKIIAFDDDIVKKENLNRLLGATRRMVGKKKVAALAPFIKSVATAKPFTLKPIAERGTTSEALTMLRDCDVIFSCVDKFAPRVPLNDLAYAHLIPTIDMASWIHSSKGTVDAIMTHAHILSPGIACAWCQQTISPLRLMREAQGNQGGIENRYGVDVDAQDDTEPSVLPLNLAGVGLALLEFMQITLGITAKTPNDLKMILPEWELDESDLSSIPDCATETSTALGDAAKIRPV